MTPGSDFSCTSLLTSMDVIDFFPISGGPRQPRKCKREASPTQSSCSNASADGTGSAANKSREVSSSFLSNAVEWPQEDLYPVSASRCQALQHTDTNLFQILCDVSSQMPYSVPRSYVNVTDSMANPYYYNYYYDNHGPPYYHSYVPRQPPPVYNYPIINPYEQKIPDECATCGSSMVGRLDEWLRNPSSRRGEWPPTRCPRCDRHWLIFRQRWPIRKVRKKYTRRATKTAEQQTQQGQSESEDKQQKLNFDKRREAKIVWSEVFHQPR
ncbi:hypothetical protein BX666DRAFT_1105846 [Dichotomocladium elegans]|nr:hypothetical protein BX666DRAFT_1105846 [Dichotomocladium elegans]